MPYQANVYNVMIATPSDLPHIRQAAKDMIIKWNSIHSSNNQIVLLPIGWESLAPVLEGSAQTIINKKILSQADLLIAIFWNRIGTPTDAFPSGTVEEIETHLKAGKLALLYFSDEPIAPSKINNAQSEAVQKLKEKFRSRGITYDFPTTDDFKMKFTDDLSGIINEDEGYFKGLKLQYSLIQSRHSQEGENVDLNVKGAIKDNNYKKEEKLSLSSPAIELLLEAEKGLDNRIEKHPLGLTPIKINNTVFGSVKDKKSLAKYYSGLQELIKKGFASKFEGGEIVQITHEGFEEANRIDSYLKADVYKEYLQLSKEFDQINESSFPVQEVRVDRKKEIGELMAKLAIDNAVALEKLERFVKEEFSEGKLVGLINVIRQNPKQNFTDKIFTYSNEAKQFFTKHAFLLAIEDYLKKGYIRKAQFNKVKEITDVYSFKADQSLLSKIEEIRRLISV